MALEGRVSKAKNDGFKLRSEPACVIQPTSNNISSPFAKFAKHQQKKLIQNKLNGTKFNLTTFLRTGIFPAIKSVINGFEGGIKIHRIKRSKITLFQAASEVFTQNHDSSLAHIFFFQNTVKTPLNPFKDLWCYFAYGFNVLTDCDCGIGKSLEKKILLA